MRSTRFPKSAFEYYLFGNFHIALCAVGLTLTTQAIFGVTLRDELITFIFCGTFFGYNLQRLPSAFENPGTQPTSERHLWEVQYRYVLLGLSTLAAIAFAWSFLMLYPRSQTMALIPAALSFAYAFPVIPGKRKWIELRGIPGIKIFVIAITWACSCALLPIASVHRSGQPWFSPAAILWTCICAALVFSLTVPFDVRDLDYDPSKLKTLPALFGVRTAIRIATVALIASVGCAWIMCGYMGIGTVRQAFAYSTWSIIAMCFIHKSSPKRHEYYFSFWIDGLIMLLWAITRIAG